MRKTIEGLGYGVEEVEPPTGKGGDQEPERLQVPKAVLPELRDAFARANADGHPVVVCFWAAWCAPCIKLKKTTLADRAVKKLLERAELVLVDLDQHPELGKAWGVASVPDVLFLAPDGRVLDRLKTYEDPGPFGQRLQAVIATVETKGQKR